MTAPDSAGAPASTSLASTPLRAVHERLGAAMSPFAGWLMPLRYSGEIAEHNAVRRAAGLFDLSHMGEILVTGPGAPAALDYALTGHLSALTPGRARYTMICAPDGGILDDLVVYRLADAKYLVVANASNAATVLQELTARAAAAGDAGQAGQAGQEGQEGQAATVIDSSRDYALIAIQGPAAAAILAKITEAPLGSLKYYACMPALIGGIPMLLARTGYTGEDGFELFCSPEHAVPTWTALQDAGARDGLVPAGLAARDTLRLEAGMPLYGNELSRDVTPFEAGLGRVVKFGKPGDFVGRSALAGRAQAGPRRRLIGLAGRGRRVPRHGYPVLLDGEVIGTVTSGAPSPALGRPIAMAYVTPDAAEALHPEGSPAGEHELAVDVRGRAERADYCELPFYRRAS
jgi:glycine cleavage system T protein (aminomethyltransferase)